MSVEEAARKRWDSIHIMVEAKCSLKWLFKQVVEARFENFELREKMAEVSVNHEESLKTLQEMATEMDEQVTGHQNAMLALEREHEEKVGVSYFLKKSIYPSYR